MNKLRVFLGVVTMLVIGAGIFYACQKEENKLINNEKKVEKLINYDDYVNKLSEQTGIKIVELSQKLYLKEFGERILIHTAQLEAETANITAEKCREQSLYWRNLSEKTINETNMNILYSYYQIFSITSYHRNDLDKVTYNGNIYLCANKMLSILKDDYDALYGAIIKDYPNFKKLDINIQQEVLIEALCYGPCEDDLKRAYKKATKKYVLTMVTCIAGNPVIAIACYIVARDSYWEEIDTAIEKYKECVNK